MRGIRGLLLLTRGYGHVIWLLHLAALGSVLTVMVYLHNSTCGLETPDSMRDIGQPAGQPGLDNSEFKVHHVRKRHLMTSQITLPADIATSNGTMPDISDNVTVTSDIAEFLAKPIINTQQYRFLHNPVDKCKGKNLKFIVMIPSGRYNHDQRRKVRMSSLKHLLLDHEHDGAMVFFLGVPPAEILSPQTAKYQKHIDEEAEKYQDIVQQDFMDTHRTLNTKAVAMLKWVNEYCNNAKYVIKLDDDIRFDTSVFLDIVERATANREKVILGQVYSTRSKVNRDPGSRYFVSEREYAQAKFPPYVMGGLLAYPMSTARLLYEGSLRVKVIPLDDVYVTGLVSQALNVSLVSDPEFTFQHHSCGAVRL